MPGCADATAAPPPCLLCRSPSPTPAVGYQHHSYANLPAAAAAAAAGAKAQPQQQAAKPATAAERLEGSGVLVSPTAAQAAAAAGSGGLKSPPACSGGSSGGGTPRVAAVELSDSVVLLTPAGTGELGQQAQSPQSPPSGSATRSAGQPTGASPSTPLAGRKSTDSNGTNSSGASWQLVG